ncbi:hypothetical protein BDB00DRAFT_33516 [Zychaea mexicana]|uniref:uncharacterized protein n=1 Tax=Zychaea mexicana TaxID=64656 RepID=UPI0022FDB856|nr:uncharacterized protein BDB00DRAFT_33516 [Zychaea mexicana]KAI9488632.1 hypothetical protein BDB00DRAFT_33516 [Zychaea mexicana]
MSITESSIEDQLSALPPEIQENILYWLTFRDRIRFTEVNKYWRSTVLNWPGTWQRFSTEDGHDIFPKLALYKPYIKGSWVKHVHASWTDHRRSDTPTLTKLVEFLLELKCDSIEKVKLNFDCSMTIPTAAHFLRTCAKTLSSLYISLHDYVDPKQPTLDDVSPDIFLFHCPNLKRLEFFGPVHAIDDERSITTTTVMAQQRLAGLKHQHLEDLRLDFGHPERDGYYDLTPYIKAAPKLRQLALHLHNIEHCNFGRSLPSLLSQHCPSLTLLILVNDGTDDLYLDDLDWYQQQHHPETTLSTKKGKAANKDNDDDSDYDREPRALTHLILNDSAHPDNSPLSADLLRQFVRRYHDKLQYLDLSGFAFFDQNSMTYLSEYAFWSLTRLVIKCSPHGSLNPYQRLLQQQGVFPILRTLILQDDGTQVDDDLLQAITHVKTLQELKLVGCGERMSPNGLRQFLMTMTHPDRSLRKLNFIRVLALNLDVLRAIGQADRCIIDELSIRACYKLTVDHFEEFFDDLIRTYPQRRDRHPAAAAATSTDNAMTTQFHGNNCKVMTKLEVFSSHPSDPSSFFDGGKGASFFKKFDHIAESWQFALWTYTPIDYICLSRKITCKKYRRRKEGLQI